MSHDVASDGFLGVGVEHGGPVHLGHHLVGQHHGHTELVRQLEQRPQKLCQGHLTGGELSSSAVVSAIAGGGAVHDHDGVPGLGHHGGGLGQQSHLVIRVVSSGVGHIVKNVASLKTVPFRYG